MAHVRRAADRVCLALAQGDFHAESMPEALFCLIFMFINVGITAYIIVRYLCSCLYPVAPVSSFCACPRTTLAPTQQCPSVRITTSTAFVRTLRALRPQPGGLWLVSGYHHHGGHQK